MSVVGWHLVAQILYFIGVMLVLLAFIFSQLQFCCHRERVSAFRTLSGVLLFACESDLISQFTRPENSELIPIKAFNT